MKRWVNIFLLVSLLGNFTAPIAAAAADTANVSETSSTASKTVGTVSTDPQTSVDTESSAIPEKSGESEEVSEISNQLQLDKTSEFSSKDPAKDAFELELSGKIDSSEENTQSITFEMASPFVLEDSKEDKVILNNQKEIIGKYSIEKNNERTTFTLNFNKLVKGENRFKLILLGTITRGPDKTLNFYQADKEILQLTLPEQEKTNTSATEAAGETTSTTSSSSEASKETSTESSSSKKKTVKKDAAPKVKEAAEPAREAGSLDDLFAKFAPGDNFVAKIDLNFAPNPPTINSTVDFNLSFAIPKAVRTEMVPGDYYEMDFPQGLSIIQPSPHGDLIDENGAVYGNYVFDADTQKLRITFTQPEGGDFLPPENGSVRADVHFDQQVITQPGQSTIVYPSKTNLPPLTINIKPMAGSSISKAGQPDTPNNPSKVTWQVDFNKDFSELDKPLITENFPDQVTFNKEETGSVTVYPLSVDFNGNVTGTGQTPLDPSTYTVNSDGSVQFKQTIDRPYRIVYSTTIKDSAKPVDGGKVSIVNNVKLTAGSIDLTASASMDLNYKKALEKVETGYDKVGQIYSWLIRYNYGQKELADDKVISDTYSSNLDILKDSFHVYAVNFDEQGNPVNGDPINPENYTIDFSGNKFTVTFKNNVQAGKAINIAYQTKVNTIVSGASNQPVTVTNRAETDHLPPTTDISENPTQQVVIKNKPKIDVGTKTAHYVIDINKNKYELENAVFTDTMTYTEEGYTSVPMKIKNPQTQDDEGVVIRDVSDNNKILTGALQLVGSNGENLGVIGDTSTADYILKVNLTPDKTGFKNFTIEFQNSYAKTAHQFKMDYYVGYNRFRESVPNPNTSVDYKNTMTVNFTNNNQPYESSSSTDFKTSTQEVNQGTKSGSYNPVTKEITWTVVANYNNLGVSMFNFSDPITGNQVYEPDSLKVTRGKINENGEFQATTAAAYDGNQVGKDYLKITAPEPTGENAQGSLQMAFGSDNNRIPGWNVTGSPMVFEIQFKTTLQGKIVYDQSTYSNTATTTIEGVEQHLSASVSIAFGGKSAVKTGDYDTKTGLIHWNIAINPNQSLLANVKVQDNPSSNQILQNSFKLYTGKYSGSGSKTTVVPDQPVPTDQYKVAVTTDPTTGQQSFSVDLSGIEEKPDPNNEGKYLTGIIEKPYVLVYDTEPNFASKTETVTNNASISSEGKELPGKDTQQKVTVTIQDSSGTAFGTKGQITVQKVDGNGGVVPGAVLELLRKNTKTNKTDVLYQTTTDSQGLATFGNLIGTSSAYEYYVKEIQAPNGYTISPELLKGKKVSVDTSSSSVTKIENEPVKVTFLKKDGSGKNLAGGLFNLYQNSGTKEEPNYTLLRLITPTDQGVDLSGLGDGQYRIQEVIAPDGYQINQTMLDFEIKKNDDNTRSVFADNQAVADGVLQMKDYQGSAVLQKSTEEGKALPGAQFSVQRAELNSEDYSDYGTQSDYVTNEDGQLRLTDLPPGKYKVKESKAPEGYYLNSREMTFSVDAVSTGDQVSAAIELNDGKALIDYKGSARFKKVDGHGYTVDQKETPLTGAKFQLYEADGKTAIGDEVTSDKDGYFVFEQLAPGTTYAIKETKAPSGYLLNQQMARFTMPLTNNQGSSAVSIDEAAQKLVADEKTPYKNYKEGVHFQKVDEAGHGLGDAKYQLLEQTEDNQWQPVTAKVNGAGEDGLFTSDKLDGNVQAFELAPGNYKFVEKAAPKGYLVNTSEIPFTVEKQAEGEPAALAIPITEKANVNYQGSVRLSKEAENKADNGFSKLKGAAFDVYTDTASPEKVTNEEIKSDEAGNVVAKGLAPGNYYFQEVSNGKAYVVNTQKIKFTIPSEAAGKPAAVTINSDGEPLSLKNYLGAVELTKVDKADQPQKGAEFTVYDSENKEAGTGVSDENGKVRIGKLAPGDYTIKETNAPADYLINDQVVSFTIAESAEGKPQTVVISEHFKNYQGAVKLIKTDDNGQPLAGAKFQLLTSDGKQVGKSISSNDHGEVIFSDLAPGDYSFQEVEAPAGYIREDTPVPVTVPKAAKGEPQVVAVKDHFVNHRGTIRLHKVGNDVKNESKIVDLKGAEFTLYTKKDFSDRNPVKALSDEKGIVEFKNLAPGTYYVKETNAPAGYLLNTFPLTFVFPDQLPATMPMTDEQNNSNKIEDGAYVIDGGDFQNFTKEIQLKKTDGESSGSLDLSKVDFSLYFDNGTASGKLIKEKIKPGSDGSVDLNTLALEKGSYKLVETKTADGYAVSSQPIYFVVNGKQKAGIKVSLANYQASIKGKKVSGSKKLAGAVFRLYKAGDEKNPLTTTDKNGKEQTDIKTTNNGAFYAKGLSAGEYTLREVTAPKGYIRDTTSHKFTIYPQKGQPATLDLGNFENYQGQAELTKVDADNQAKQLANAEFQLLDEEQTVVQKNLKTDNQGKIQITQLAPGTYSFKETKAPKGYQLSKQAIKFTVPATYKGKPDKYQVVAKNKVMPTPTKAQNSKQTFYPKTGETKGRTFLIIGVLLVIFVIGFYLVGKRKKND